MFSTSLFWQCRLVLRTFDVVLMETKIKWKIIIISSNSLSSYQLAFDKFLVSAISGEIPVLF